LKNVLEKIFTLLADIKEDIYIKVFQWDLKKYNTCRKLLEGFKFLFSITLCYYCFLWSIAAEYL